LKKAHEAWPELAEYAEKLQKHYPAAVPECHRIVLEDGAITLDLWFGDIKDCMPQVPYNEQGLIDAWFLDGFAPSKNPEMWNQGLFNNMAKLAKQDCTVATFTAAGFVRRGLNEAGFTMKKVKGFGTKREMIAGSMEQREKQSNHLPWFNRTASSNLDSIAIIGGGIASAALAKTLVRRGQNVTLYCKDKQPAKGASGNRQGAVYPLLNGPHTGVSRVFAPAFLFARQFVEQAAQEIDFDHDWCGVTQLMWDDKSTDKLEKMLAGNFTPELIQKLSAEETANTIGLPIDMASVHYPMGGQVSHAPATETLSQLKTVLCYDGYMTPVNPSNQHLCVGASYDRSHLDYEFDENAQKDNAEKLVKCVPNQTWAKEVDITGNQSRQGIRCVSRDHLPFVGNVGDFETIKTQYANLQNQKEEEVETIHQYPDLFCFLGLGSRGLSSAPLLAEVLASQICGDPLPLPVDVLTELHPSRMWVRKLRKGKAITEL
ncbi:FAD-dependent 5-carboxymethylaminomethyl-2-thiouridine(34) oxidoreductase MnmC, partial [Vibrio alginolyticus]